MKDNLKLKVVGILCFTILVSLFFIMIGYVNSPSKLDFNINMDNNTLEGLKTMDHIYNLQKSREVLNSYEVKTDFLCYDSNKDNEINCEVVKTDWSDGSFTFEITLFGVK